MNIEQLESRFEELIVPTNFVTLFRDIEEFREWCNGGSIEDLRYTLDAFKQYEEIYEYCAIIVEVMCDKNC